MFIKQALSFDRSCTHVVNEFIIENVNSLPINKEKRVRGKEGQILPFARSKITSKRDVPNILRPKT